MKLQSQVSRKVGDTEYRKSWVVIPNKTLKELDWEEGEELESIVKDNELVLRKAKTKDI